MNKESLTLIGRVVNVNAADQSFLIESKQSRSRLWVYADDKMFKKLNYSLKSAWFNDAKGKEPCNTFYIQGRVLTGFKKGERKSLAERFPALTVLAEREVQSRLDVVKAFDAVKYQGHPR
jgi:hypothetical protein